QELPAAAHPAHLVQQLAQRGSDRTLEAQRALDSPAAAVQLRAGAFGILGETLEPLRSVAGDAGHARQRLDVVHGGRPSPQPARRGERWLRARLCLLALERVQERRLLAADVAAAGAVDVDVERPPGAHHGRPQDPGRARLVDRPLQAVRLLEILATD